MARIDPTRAQIVIRLVYDGPAMAGKTSSLRALARGLGVEMFSGQEAEGRTLYLDWVDYVGGLFEGMPIRCQIVTVPGQAVLESRRRQLLGAADAVVFVVDSRAERMAENRRCFEALQEIAGQASVPVGIVVQANKRDVADAASLDEIRAALGDGDCMAMTEAVAERGEGVRETFVLAVRFALDRVRALGTLESGVPEIESGAELLAAMMESEGSALTASAPAPAAIAAAPSDAAPRPPDASIAPGLVWPPVNGRAVVHEAARETLALERDATGAWRGLSASGRWSIHSPATASFHDFDEGRAALIAWARWHTTVSDRLTPHRAIVLAPSATGEWRLWQIVRASQTLRDLWREAIHLPALAAGERLFDLIDLRWRAHETLVAPGLVEHVEFTSVAVSANGEALYAAPADYPPPAAAVTPASASDARTLIEYEIAAALREELTATPKELADLLAGIELAGMRRSRNDEARALRRSLLND